MSCGEFHKGNFPQLYAIFPQSPVKIFHRSTKIYLHPQTLYPYFVRQKILNMDIVFVVNFIVFALQILIGESSYTHRQILPPSFAVGFLLGFWVGTLQGRELALLVFGLAFIGKFFVASLRMAWMLRTQTEIGSRKYYQFMAWGAMVETAAVWVMVKNLG
jgi:hypothetical protein